MKQSGQDLWLTAYAMRIVVAFALLFVMGDECRSESPRPTSETLVTSVGMTVGDIDRSVAFYRDVLGFEKVSEQEVAGDGFERLTGVFGSRAIIVRMRLGDEVLELTQFLAPRGRPMPQDSRSNDLWFQHVAVIVRDINEAYARLRQAKVEHASSGPQRLPDWNPSAGGIQAFYFRDPDGHFLEILQFPEGKGDPRWRRTTDKLFLGIDHTAVVVADTDASLKFYHDLLGLKVVGTSENYGTEQEHLNNVFGADCGSRRYVQTTGQVSSYSNTFPREMAAPARPMPARTTLSTGKRRSLFTTSIRWQRSCARRRTTLVSPDVSTTESAHGSSNCLLVRDPDGHAVMLVD